MDDETFDQWLSAVAFEYVDCNRIDPLPKAVLDGFVGWASAKYALEMDNIARDKLSDPSCCGGVCKEESDVQNV